MSTFGSGEFSCLDLHLPALTFCFMQLTLLLAIQVNSTDTHPVLNLISNGSKYALAKPEAATWLSL